MTNPFSNYRVLVRGAGEMATACIRRLHLAGFKLLLLECEQPLCVRRTVCLAEAVYERQFTVENVTAVLVDSLSNAESCWSKNNVPLMIDPEAKIILQFKPDIIIDARMKKRDIDSTFKLAKKVIGLGPGFIVGKNCHTVIETMRGHTLGRVIHEGSAIADTAIPGEVGGETINRILRAPANGIFISEIQIGDLVSENQQVAKVDDLPVLASISGILRGLIRNGTTVSEGLKIGDIDPRGEKVYCYSISDKANAIAGGVLEAVLDRN